MSIIIIRDMEASGATSGIRILGPAAVIKLGSIQQIIRSQFIVPSMNQKHQTSTINHQRTELSPTLVMKSEI